MSPNTHPRPPKHLFRPLSPRPPSITHLHSCGAGYQPAAAYQAASSSVPLFPSGWRELQLAAPASAGVFETNPSAIPLTALKSNFPVPNVGSDETK
jgi:hypothetical protein